MPVDYNDQATIEGSIGDAGTECHYEDEDESGSSMS